MIKILLILLFFLIFAAFCFLVFAVLMIKEADHREMVALAVSDYLNDGVNFVLSHYPGVTEEEIQSHIKRMANEQKKELKRSFNDKADTFFDEL